MSTEKLMEEVQLIALQKFTDDFQNIDHLMHFLAVSVHENSNFRTVSKIIFV